MNVTLIDAPTSERARLVGAMDGYLRALAARDPGLLRLTPDFRCTEDSQPLPLGSGVWRTVRGVRPGGQYFVDEQAGQVEFWGVVDEMGQDAIISIRLKVEGRVISEVETIVTRKQGEYFDPPVILQDASSGFHRTLPRGERSSRAELVRAANLYFDAIELSAGDLVPLFGDCRRLVNGTLDSLDDPASLPADGQYRALDVAQQISDGHYAYIEALRERRFPVIDEARGLVVCHLLFDHPGDLPRAGGSIPFGWPNSMLFTEVFKVVGGAIEEVWALGTASLPYGCRSGWPI
ncbi:MAG: hypothetical protein WDM92_04235 [Caulobacteraceae bacterium]